MRIGRTCEARRLGRSGGSPLGRGGLPGSPAYALGYRSLNARFDHVRPLAFVHCASGGVAEAVHLSVKEVVDRRGLEPLTSAVQAHPLFC